MKEKTSASEPRRRSKRDRTKMSPVDRTEMAVRELMKKRAIHNIETSTNTIVIDIDVFHKESDLGNKSWGHIDYLRKYGFKVEKREIKQRHGAK